MRIAPADFFERNYSFYRGKKAVQNIVQHCDPKIVERVFGSKAITAAFVLTDDDGKLMEVWLTDSPNPSRKKGTFTLLDF
jgi:hypothetical protein